MSRRGENIRGGERERKRSERAKKNGRQRKCACIQNLNSSQCVDTSLQFVCFCFNLATQTSVAFLANALASTHTHTERDAGLLHSFGNQSHFQLVYFGLASENS